MFSINPGYDYHHGNYAIGSAEERMALYRRCEAEGVGISVMKAFSGGQLLDARTSPFGQALTEYQCIQYALDKPGRPHRAARRPGPEGSGAGAGLFRRLRPEERDYSVLGTFTPKDAAGRLRLLQPLPALPGRIGCGARSTNITIWHRPGDAAGQGPLRPSWKRRRATASSAATVTAAAPSMWSRLGG